MNYSAFPVYSSKANLTNDFVDRSNVFLLPSICLFGILTNIPCLVVCFKRDESNAKIFDYILINSVIDFVFLILELFVFIIRCGNLCPYGYTYLAKAYEIYIFQYTGYIFVTAQVLLNIYVAYDRLKMFSGKLTSQKPISIYIVLAICTVISALANALPYPIARDITVVGLLRPDPNSTYLEVLYVRSLRKEFTTHFMQNFVTVWMVIKNPVLFIVLSFLNVWVTVRFRMYLKSRKQLLKRAIGTEATTAIGTVRVECQTTGTTNETSKSKSSTSSDRKENNLTLLTLIYCVKLLVGNSIDSFAVILNVFQVDIYVKYGFINIVGNSLFFASHGLSFFLYYFFYNVFRTQFLRIFFFSK